MAIPGIPLGGGKRKFAHGQQRGKNMLAAAAERNSAKKPARASAARRNAGRSPSALPTPDVRPVDVGTFQRTPTTTVRAPTAAPRAEAGESPATVATPRARAPLVADGAPRRMSFAPPSPTTRASNPQTHAETARAARRTPPRDFPAPESSTASPRAATRAAPPPKDIDRTPPSMRPSRASVVSVGKRACGSIEAPIDRARVSPTADDAEPGAAPATAEGFGPPVAANPFAAAANAAKRRKRVDKSASPVLGTALPVSAAARTDWVLPRRTDDARSVGVGDGVFDAFSRRDETLSSTTAARVPGFVNLGNTCYLASSAQLVLGLRSFVEDTERVLRAVARVGPDATPDATASLRGEDEEEDGAFPVTRAALDLMRRRGDVSAAAALSPARLKRAVQRRHPRYEGYEQHDAHEFLGSMLDAMEEETTSAYEAGSGRLLPLVRESATASAAAASAATETNAMDSSPERAKGLGIAVVSSGIVPLHRTSCPTRRAFTGAAAVTLTCATCGDVSTKMESFRHLSLELAPSDSRAAASAPLALQALLARWFAPETVERRCAREGCGGTRAVMARRLLRAPRVLLAHLKRFRAEAPIRIDRDVSRDAAGSSSTAFVPPRMVKDFTSVELPERVSLASFADAGSVRGPPVGFPEASASPFAAAEPPVADEAAAATRAFADDGSSRGAAALAQIGAYRLSGIIAHSGESMRRGHYVAGAYAPASEATGLRGETKRWTTFDDERVCPAGSVGEPAKFDDWTLRNWYVAAFECDC